MSASHRLQELASQKEQELQRIREEQYLTLESALKSCEDELRGEKEKRKALEDDFKYNLSVIEQRDHELSRYDAAFQQIKKVINDRTAELSDCRVQIDELQIKLKQAIEEKGQLKQYYIHRLEQQQINMDQFCKSKDNDVSQQRAEYERLQKQLEQKLLRVEEELENEKQQLKAFNDEKIKSIEQKHQKKLDEMAATLLSKESHIRQLQRELATTQTFKEETQTAASTIEERVKELETELREKDWNHTDTVNTLEARISELEGRLSHSETTNKSIRTEFDIKRVEQERFCKEKETALQTAKECHRHRETELERQLGELRAQMEQQEIENRRKEWNHKDELTEKEQVNEKLQNELVKVREERERILASHTQEKVQLDLQLQSLRTSYDKVKDDLQARVQDIERYKHEIHLATEREQSLERCKNQMELDWQLRLEEMERNQYGRQEELLKTLTTARDEAVTHCKQLEHKLIERVKVCECIRQERDIALDALQKKGLTEIAQEILQGRGSSKGFESLQRQNQELREVIRHMRNEMEQLTVNDDNVKKENEQNKTTCSKSYIRYIEKELEQLKQENKKLCQASQSNGKPPIPSKVEKRKNKMDPKISKALKTALASFQKEKATYEFDLAQLRSRLRELEASSRRKEEQVYLEKALQVPSDKVRQKLLEATQVIIQLVKEREEWKIKEHELASQVHKLQELLSKQDCDDSEIEDDNESSEENTNNQQGILQQSTEIPKSKVMATKTEPHSSQLTSGLNISLRNVPTKHLLEPELPLKDLTNLSKQKSPFDELLKEHTSPDQEHDLSLSPLKFSDTSFYSGLDVLQKALADEEQQKFSSTPLMLEKQINDELFVEGKRVTQSKTNLNKKVNYKAPRPRQNAKLKVRNYNIKDD